MLMWKKKKKKKVNALLRGHNKPLLIKQKDDKNIHKALFIPQPI